VPTANQSLAAVTQLIEEERDLLGALTPDSWVGLLLTVTIDPVLSCGTFAQPFSPHQRQTLVCSHLNLLATSRLILGATMRALRVALLRSSIFAASLRYAASLDVPMRRCAVRMDGPLATKYSRTFVMHQIRKHRQQRRRTPAHGPCPAAHLGWRHQQPASKRSHWPHEQGWCLTVRSEDSLLQVSSTQRICLSTMLGL
jgi:hypothetical protein